MCVAVGADFSFVVAVLGAYFLCREVGVAYFLVLLQLQREWAEGD